MTRTLDEILAWWRGGIEDTIREAFEAGKLEASIYKDPDRPEKLEALLEAAVAWRKERNGPPYSEMAIHLWNATFPFLPAPAPAPTRAELLEREHEIARVVVEALRITNKAGVTKFEEYEAAHRAVEEAPDV